jgi:hypothetical protein
MQPKTVDKFLDSADETARFLGGKSFEEGSDLAYRIFSRMAALFETIRTREDLARKLAKSELSKGEEWLLLAVVRFAPFLLKFGIRKLNEFAEKSLPSAPNRQPAVPATKQVIMLEFINKLHFENGISKEDAMQRAATRFGCAKRTVERYYANRVSILENGPEPTFHDVVDGLREVYENKSAEQGGSFRLVQPGTLTDQSRDSMSELPD